MEHIKHMEDMGHKMKGPEVAPSNNGKTMYPSLYLDKIPQELKGKEIGHVCRLELVGKIVSISENDNGSNMSIEVQKLGYTGKAGKLSEKEYLSKPKEEREEYDKEQVMGDEDDQ